MEKGEMISSGRTAEIFAWKDDQVLKLFLKEFSAEDAEFEARVTEAAHKAGLPVPAVEGAVKVDDRAGIVFERVEGPIMTIAMVSRPWKFFKLARMMAELHQAMHSCEMPGLPSQREALKRIIRDRVALPSHMKEALLKVLEQLPDSNALCHGDFHPENILMTARGPIVIDWLTAKRGDPMADVARTSLVLRLAAVPQFMAGRWLINMFRARLHSIYLKRYLQLRPAPREQIAAWELPLITARLADSIPEERDLLLAFIEKALSSQR